METAIVRVGGACLLALFAALCAGCGSDRDSAVPPAPLTLEERGARVFRACAACHIAAPPDRKAIASVGPNLWGVYGARAGARGDFAYSKAMRNADLIWNDETLDAYLEKPNRYIVGNRMSFAGLPDPEDRAAVIAYLKTFQ